MRLVDADRLKEVRKMPSKVQCKHCANLINEWCARVIDSPDADMLRSCPYYKALTNADRIRSMTDEELAVFFTSEEYDGRFIFFCPAEIKGDCSTSACRACFLRWLKQEVN